MESSLEIKDQAVPNRGEDRRISRFFGAPKHKLSNLSRLREEVKLLREGLIKDHLTGVYNRRGLEEISEKYIERWKRDNGESQLVVFVIDLDYFKEVNDSLGHEFGDELLKTVSGSWQNTLRAEDVVAVVTESRSNSNEEHESPIGRTGGDEFVILAFTENPEVIKNRLQGGFSSVLNSLELPGDLKSKLGFSMGHAIIGEGFEEGKDVLKLKSEDLFSKAKEIADRRMYEEKKGKKDEGR